MSRHKVYPKELRKVVVRIGARKFFVDQGEAAAYRSRAGASFFREPVHVVDGSPFFIDGSGRCDHCRTNGIACVKSFKNPGISVPSMPISPSDLLPRAAWSIPRGGPVHGMRGSRGSGRRLRPFIPVPSSALFFEQTFHDQLEKTMAALSKKLKARIEYETQDFFREAAFFCGDSIRVALAVGQSVSQLRELRSKIYLDSGLIEPANLPEPEVISAEEHYQRCRRACDRAVLELDAFLKSVLPVGSNAGGHIVWSWRQWADENLLRVRQMLKLSGGPES